MGMSIIPVERIEQGILQIRGQKIMLSPQLAALYGVTPGALMQAVKRNLERFPPDFMFQLSPQEFDNLKSQIVISRWGGRRHLPYAFTEQGVAMLSSVLRSPRAVQVNVEIMRTFVRLRRMLQSHADLAQKLVELEKKYDKRFAIVFEAIRQLMEPPEPEIKRPPIGFHTVHLTDDERTAKRLARSGGNASQRRATKAPAPGRGFILRNRITTSRKSKPAPV